MGYQRNNNFQIAKGWIIIKHTDRSLNFDFIFLSRHIMHNTFRFRYFVSDVTFAWGEHTIFRYATLDDLLM